MADSRADEIIKRADALKNERANFDSQWDEIARVVLPCAATFSALGTPGQKFGQNLMDSTGIHSNELLSAGFFSLLTSPSQPWFVVSSQDEDINNDYFAKVWMSEVSKIMAKEIQKPSTGFTTSLHEGYLSYGAFGNQIMFVTERKDMDSLLYCSLPLRECYFIENDEGFVNTLFRRYERTVLQLVERFGLDKVHEKVRKQYEQGKYNEKVKCVHVIAPNRFASAFALSPTNFAYTSTYVDEDNKVVMDESGFHEQPFMAARFFKLAWESYGRGPGSTALADLKMLQEMVKTVLRGAQKMVDPPLMAPDEGFISPIRATPGGINYYRSGSPRDDRIMPLITGGQPNIGLDLIHDTRTRIREVFYVDQLQLNQGPEMTATEVMTRSEEKMRLMGPILGRTTTELLTPLLIRSFMILLRKGKFPPPPKIMVERGPQLRIVFTSPIAKAQEQVGANNLMRAFQVASPFISLKPESIDVLNVDNMVRGVADMFSLDPRFLNTDDVISEIRKQRNDMQMQAQAAEMSKNSGIGLSATADAAKTLGEIEV